MARGVAASSRDHIEQFYTNNIDISTKTLYLGFGNSEDHDIDESLARDMLKGLHLLSSIRPDDPVRILMNCSGGQVEHGMAVYDAIRDMQCPVHIDVYGKCYSMAAWILQAADVRRMSKHSSMMIHNGEESLGGRKDEIKSAIRFSKELDAICEQILLDRIREKNPSYPKSKLDKMLATDTYLWPEQALELGLIDEVIE